MPTTISAATVNALAELKRRDGYDERLRTPEDQRLLSGRRRQIQAMAEAYTEEAIATLVAIMRSSPETSERQSAAEYLLNRAHGKPAQAVSIDQNVTHNHNFALVIAEASKLNQLRDEKGVTVIDGYSGTSAADSALVKSSS